MSEWWSSQLRARGFWGAGRQLLRELWEFARDSTPERRRSRYGDMDYDWEQRVDTTSGTVGWRERLLGQFHSLYQPSDPAMFREMMAALPIDFQEFTFIDIGSGKGRTLLMASEYPLEKIVGVELLPQLHRIAEANIAGLAARKPTAAVSRIESVCADAREFVFPDKPLVVYLFNPLPEAALRRVIQNLEDSWRKSPRTIWIVYHNPVMENVLVESPVMVKEARQQYCSLFRMGSGGASEMFSEPPV